MYKLICRSLLCWKSLLSSYNKPLILTVVSILSLAFIVLPCEIGKWPPWLDKFNVSPNYIAGIPGCPVTVEYTIVGDTTDTEIALTVNKAEGGTPITLSTREQFNQQYAGNSAEFLGGQPGDYLFELNIDGTLQYQNQLPVHIIPPDGEWLSYKAIFEYPEDQRSSPSVEHGFGITTARSTVEGVPEKDEIEYPFVLCEKYLILTKLAWRGQSRAYTHLSAPLSISIEHRDGSIRYIGKISEVGREISVSPPIHVEVGTIIWVKQTREGDHPPDFIPGEQIAWDIGLYFEVAK